MNTVADRLDRRSIPITECGCLIWLGTVDKKTGYGSMRISGKMVKTHRASWAVHRGPIPDGLKVLHRCDIPSCMNPDHLFLGTQTDNMRDMAAKGRKVPLPGERNGMAKLTARQVLEIRSRRGTLLEVSRLYGVTQSMISRIRLGKSWTTI